MDSDILDNLDGHVFYHGTSREVLEAVQREGFRCWFEIEPWGRVPNYGVLGIGTYITCNWRTALGFGNVLLQVGLRRGTRILNVWEPPDPKVLQYLRREFGNDILRRPPWKVLPANKNLTLRETVALSRYHYKVAYGREFEPGSERTSSARKHSLHYDLLHSFRRMLVRHGFDGFGDPQNIIGIVVFDPGRLVLQDVVLDVPGEVYERINDSQFPSIRNLDELKELCR